MKVQLTERVPARRGALGFLEIEFTSKARRVRVTTTAGLEPMDVNGERPGGAYDAAPALSRLHVPLRVTQDTIGTSKVSVSVEDVAGVVAPETWQGDVTLEAAGRKKAPAALLLLTFAAVAVAIALFVVMPLMRPTSVPSLVGKPVAEAERSLRALGFAPTTVWEDGRGAEHEGRVFKQVPDAGAQPPKDAPVMIWVGRPRAAATSIEVPQVVGRPRAEAEGALAGTGLVLRVTTEDAGAEMDGRVLSQHPGGGTRVAPGAEVALVVGKLNTVPQRDVPDVVGLARADAEAAVKSAGLVVAVDERDTPVENVGKVLAQAPAGGARGNEGSSVTLTIGREAAPAPVTEIPDVVGRTNEDAARALSDAGFIADISIVNEKGAPGTVLSQDPPPGTARKGATIRLRVAAGASPVVVVPTPTPTPTPTPPQPTPTPPVVAKVIVPDLIGLSRAAAEFEMRKAGLSLRVKEEDAGEDTPEGLVLRQTPSAGDSAKDGGVEIVVAHRAGPAVATRPLPTAIGVPNVIGRVAEDALVAIRERNLVPRVQEEDTTPERAGLVLRQDPAAGTASAAGTSVVLVVGRAKSGSPTTTQPQPTTSNPPVATKPPVTQDPPPTSDLPPIVVQPLPTADRPLPPPQRRTGPPLAANPPTSAPPPSGAPQQPWQPPTLPPTRPGVGPPPASRPPTVSTGPAPALARGPNAGAASVTIPDLQGRDAAEACEVALRLGLLPSIRADRDARAPAGRVRLQEPVAGTSVRTGSTLVLSVGGGFSTSMVEVPSVVGLSLSEASSRLAGAGFTAHTVRVAARPGVLAGGDQVVAQTPVGRFTADQARVIRIFLVGP